MRLEDLVRFILSENDLAARQWIKDFKRTEKFNNINSFEYPEEFDKDEISLCVAAGIIEMLAERFNQKPPEWTFNVKECSNEIVLCKYINKSEKLKTLCKLKGPESLKKRNILAYPDYLNVL